MHPLEKKFITVVTDGRLVPAGATVVVAFSGGPDSTALLHLLHRFAADLHIRVTAVHVNHGLRPPAETDAEEQFVQETSRRLGIDLVLRRLKVRRYARARKTGIEEAARHCRYLVLHQAAGQQKAGIIAVGHTADDQAEELLLRLLRGCGREGLAGMKTMRQGTIIRPLLGVRKQELLDYLTDKEIGWCRDSSNDTTLFLRNRVRQQLLPYLAEHFNPAIHATLHRTASILRDEEELLSSLTEDACSRVVQTGSQGDLLLNVDRLLAEPIAIGRRIIERTLLVAGCPPSFDRIEQIRLLARKQAGRRLHLHRGLRVIREAGHLRFSRPQGITRRRGDLTPAPADYRYTVSGPGRLNIAEIDRTVEFSFILRKEHALPASRHVVLLDGDKINFPLVVRARQPGDRIRPPNAPGRKKIADLLRDRQIPAADRTDYPILTDQNGAIIAIAGLCPAHGYHATPATATVLAVHLTKLFTKKRNRGK